MRKVILYMQSTLNGHGVGDDMEWLTVSDETWDVVGGLQERCDTALLGRVSFEEFSEFWPGAAEHDSHPPGLFSHARWLTDSQKVVFTKTLEKADWKNTRLVSDDLVDEVKKLREDPGKDLLLLGGIGLANAFAEKDLIDEYWVLLNPGTISSGRQLFTTKLNLRLIEAKQFESGVVALHYGRKP